jgi:hypothetical protein
MNVISYINGDAQITDFPVCSARPLAALVQSCNDLLARPDGYLSPEGSVLALDLGWQTVGTAKVPNPVIHAWIADVLANPTWGVVRYAKLTAIKVIIDIAELHRRIASGDMPPIEAWDAADRAARAAARAVKLDRKRRGTVCLSGRIRIDRTRRHLRPGRTGRRDRLRAACARVGDRGHHGKPRHTAHSPCHPLMA